MSGPAEAAWVDVWWGSVPELSVDSVPRSVGVVAIACRRGER